jgi:hypothetical protein
VLLLTGLAVRGGEPKAVPFARQDEVRKGDGFLVVADRRAFATMAFLNAAGFDEEDPNRPMHAVRAKARKRLGALLKKHPDEATSWRRYYESLPMPGFTPPSGRAHLRARRPPVRAGAR